MLLISCSFNNIYICFFPRYECCGGIFIFQKIQITRDSYVVWTSWNRVLTKYLGYLIMFLKGIIISSNIYSKRMFGVWIAEKVLRTSRFDKKIQISIWTFNTRRSFLNVFYPLWILPDHNYKRVPIFGRTLSIQFIWLMSRAF